jgi:hypothetical protein
VRRLLSRSSEWAFALAIGVGLLFGLKALGVPGVLASLIATPIVIGFALGPPQRRADRRAYERNTQK